MKKGNSINWIPDWIDWIFFITLLVSRVTNINFLLTTSADQQDLRLWELLNWSSQGERFDLKPNSLNYSLKKCMEIRLENLYVILGLKGLKVEKRTGDLWRLLEVSKCCLRSGRTQKILFWMKEHYGKRSGKIKKCETTFFFVFQVSIILKDLSMSSQNLVNEANIGKY